MASADITAEPVKAGEARVNKHKADWRGWKFMWPFAVVFVFVFIIPIVYAIYISFFKKQMIGG
ncbi:ABC transporter permease, partial [Bifidobacterium sp. DSM 109959]|nr:ABC transporter permease [Bifidobacterium sp. DSM 109959]